MLESLSIRPSHAVCEIPLHRNGDEQMSIRPELSDRDLHVLTKALAVAIEALRHVPRIQRPTSDIDDMKELLNRWPQVTLKWNWRSAPPDGICSAKDRRARNRSGRFAPDNVTALKTLAAGHQRKTAVEGMRAVLGLVLGHPQASPARFARRRDGRALEGRELASGYVLPFDRSVPPSGRLATAIEIIGCQILSAASGNPP